MLKPVFYDNRCIFIILKSLVKTNKRSFIYSLVRVYLNVNYHILYRCSIILNIIKISNYLIGFRKYLLRFSNNINILIEKNFVVQLQQSSSIIYSYLMETKVREIDNIANKYF